MHLIKRTLALLFVISIGYQAFAQPPAKDPKDKLFGAKRPSEVDDPNGRTVQGIITDDSGNFLEGAVVTLTNLKTSKGRSFIAKKDGAYRFDSLSMDVDYDLIASYKGGKSETKKVSRFDARKQAVRNLTVAASASLGQPVK